MPVQTRSGIKRSRVVTPTITVAATLNVRHPSGAFRTGPHLAEGSSTMSNGVPQLPPLVTSSLSTVCSMADSPITPIPSDEEEMEIAEEEEQTEDDPRRRPLKRKGATIFHYADTQWRVHDSAHAEDDGRTDKQEVVPRPRKRLRREPAVMQILADADSNTRTQKTEFDPQELIKKAETSITITREGTEIIDNPHATYDHRPQKFVDSRGYGLQPEPTLLDLSDESHGDEAESSGPR